MRKLLNDPFAAVDEMIEGVREAFGARLEVTPSGRGLISAERSPNRRVGVIVGGGSGHEPAFFGYLGPGLADGAAVGNVFASPSAVPIVEAAHHVHRGAGVLFVFGNYDGDVMNFGMASELLADQGIANETVVVTDDVSSAPRDRVDERRGVAGDVVVLKVAGARADEGATLDEVCDVARHANRQTRTVGVGLGPCSLPTAAAPTFELADGDMDIGMGIHGEAGISRGPLESADRVADTMVDAILADAPPSSGDAIHVIVNTLGATPVMEGYLIARRVAARLRDEGLQLHRLLVGEYVTSLEMAGLSVTMTVVDDELERLLDAPATALSAPQLRGWR